MDGVPILLGLMIWTRVLAEGVLAGAHPVAYFIGAGAGLAIPPPSTTSS
jgi:hypothetical protein